MALRRMLSKSLSTSRRFARLHELVPDLAEFAQSLYPLLNAHADDFGRQAGDVFTVRLAVHPTSPRTPDEFERALAAMDEVHLIQRYGPEGEEVIAIVKFDEHQPGLSKRTKSKFPAPPELSRGFPAPPELSRGSREFPGKSRASRELPKQLNRRELNGTELNGTKQEQERAPVAPTRDLLALFDDHHQRKFSTKAAITAGKDAKLIAQLWVDRQGDPVTVPMLIAAFFASADPWIPQAGYTVGVLVSQVGKLIPIAAKANRAPEVDWFEECKRLHENRCNGRHMHGIQMAIDAGKAEVPA